MLSLFKRCHNLDGDNMTEYVDKLCRLGIPACSAVMIAQDFLKNFGTTALDEYIEELERDSLEAWEGLDCVY